MEKDVFSLHSKTLHPRYTLNIKRYTKLISVVSDNAREK